MDWVALPPEINSARMYAGPGAEPLNQAASAWATLAAELGTTSESIATVVAGLTTTWLGSSANAMREKVMGYVEWLESTSVLAGQSAVQAAAAAAAYEAAFMATVPPPVIAENRTQLATLVATNFLGINTPAIMATETHYVEMWAQDAAAMFGYQASSAEASALPPFNPLAVKPLLGLNIFQPGSDQSATGLAGLLNLLSGSNGSAAGSFLNSNMINSWASSGLSNNGAQSAAGLLGLGGTGGQQQQDEPSGVQPGEPPTYPIGPDAPKVLVGRASSVGGLSVPPSWGAGPRPMAALNETPVDDTRTSQFAGVPGVPLFGGTRAVPEAARYGIRPTKVMSRHPSAG